MVDFSKQINKAAGASLQTVLCAAMDAAIVAKSKAEYEAGRGSGDGEVAAKRIGAGYIGLECGRELAFRYHKYPKEIRPRDEDSKGTSPGELQRHALSGHWAEELTAQWLRMAGLTVLTCKADMDNVPILDAYGKPKQIGWKAARDPDTGKYQMAGEVDGVITAILNPDLIPLLKPPTIWENKKATDKKWKKFSKEGVKGADPKYYGQLQTNMAYLDISSTLFTMLNLDNMKFYVELVMFSASDAQAMTDRAAKVLQSKSPFEFAQLGRSSDDFKCRYCDFHGQCWDGLVLNKAPTVAEVAQAAAVWPTAPVFNPNWSVPPRGQ